MTRADLHRDLAATYRAWVLAWLRGVDTQSALEVIPMGDG